MIGMLNLPVLGKEGNFWSIKGWSKDYNNKALRYVSEDYSYMLMYRPYWWRLILQRNVVCIGPFCWFRG